MHMFLLFASGTNNGKTSIRYTNPRVYEISHSLLQVYHFTNMICIWHPFECAMGLDGTLTSHIERVADEFDMACQSAI